VTTIRPLERADLPEVARLYVLVTRDGSATPDPEVESFFGRTLLDQPWIDPALPSLVAVDGDKIVGFIGSNVRRMTFDGRPVRMVCSAHLVSHPRVRNRAVGAKLMKALLDGPQDLTITDGATDTVRRMWEAFGGHVVHLGALSFVRLFRPWSLGTDLLLERRISERLRPPVRGLSRGLDRVTELAAARRLRPERPSVASEPLTPALLVEHAESVAGPARLRTAYDAGYVAWLFDELRRVEVRGTVWAHGVPRGPLWAELVSSDGRVVGWYVCHLRRGGFCRVLQFASTARGAETVFAQLSFRAWELHAAALSGRLEPRLVAPVTAARCLIRPSGGRLLVHARDAEMAGAVRAGDAFLTQMDGEWW